MAWNIEVAGVRTHDAVSAVPEVFGPAGTTVGFEDATSSARWPDLCAARVGDWTVVIDVGCRLSESVSYLAGASASTDLYLVRIADEPALLHYRDGAQMTAARGLAACLEITPRADRDGESCAMDLLAERTGVSFTGDLWTAEFMLFALD